MNTKPAVLLFFLILIGYFVVHLVNSCNESFCSSIVSKCLLIQSCMCTSDNYTCHRNCFVCLGSYYSECCSCLGICTNNHNSTNNALNKQSHVETFPEAIPELFNALTEFPDELNRWKVTNFPVHINISHQYVLKNEKQQQNNDTINSASVVQQITNQAALNCTVIFMQQCMNWHKCKKSCETMGASSYRWFHDGCCECVGQNCIYYGIQESRCENCPLKNQTSKTNKTSDYEDHDYDYDDSEYGDEY